MTGVQTCALPILLERGIGRHGYDAYVGEAKVGFVSSGTQTPHVKKAIGMAYLPIEHTALDTEFDIDIRGRRTRARRADALLQEAEIMAYPANLKYTKDHEWIDLADDKGRVGITDYAQQQLGDVVYVELPEVGAKVKQGQSFGTIESVKAVSELYSPVTGEIVEVNSALKDKPETVNANPHDSWMVVIKLTNPTEAGALLDAAQYQDLVK